jgi:hypothetical protein
MLSAAEQSTSASTSFSVKRINYKASLGLSERVAFVG